MEDTDCSHMAGSTCTDAVEAVSMRDEGTPAFPPYRSDTTLSGVDKYVLIACCTVSWKLFVVVAVGT